jgi:hypothetical protein
MGVVKNEACFILHNHSDLRGAILVDCTCQATTCLSYSVPEVGTENWRVSTVAQNSENGLYEHGSGSASVMNRSHLNVFWQQ